MEDQGFGDLRGPPPLLSPEAEQARHCWHFCGGWRPDLWTTYGALFDVTDWHQLIELMQELRAHG
jgi:hypothetical protein